MAEYKTLRVPESAYEEAKEAKEERGLTWGEWLTQPCSNDVEDTPVVQLEATERKRIADEVEDRLR